MDEYYRLAQCLPQPYAAELAALPIRCAPYVQEIRLRAGQSMLFTVNGRVSPAAKYLPRADRLRRLSRLVSCFMRRHGVNIMERLLISRVPQVLHPIK